MNHPLISIVLTTYNSRATLPLVLNAISEQTYPLNRIEMIIVDGGSKDETISIIKKFLEENGYKFFAVQLIIHDKNYGVSKARNDGIKVSQGGYILILDADVVLSNNAIESMVNKLKEGCCDVVLAFLYPSHQFKLDKIKLRIAREIDCKSLDTYYATNAALISRKVIEKVGFFNEKMGPPFSLHEDIEYGARIKSAGFKICRYRYITAQHFSAEHDLGVFEVHEKQGFEKVSIRYLLSYFTTWYGRSYSQFIRQLPKLEKIKWFSYSLIPITTLGLVVSLLLNSLIAAMLALVVMLVILVITLNEYFNSNVKLLSVIYTVVAVVIRTIRVISVIKYCIVSKTNIISNLLISKRRRLP